ncbi:MAG TPA: PAS domain S-box protein [Pyrinomonadaceae bacterium]|nr:PAS domain S-box protein [Pyrinomonadaceae bacterium]
MLDRFPTHLLDLAHMVVLDLQGIIVFWTKGTQQMYGWSSLEAVGKVARDLLQTEFPEPLEQIRAKLAGEGEWQGELVHTKKDGQRIVVASHWVLHKDEHNNPYILEVNNDVTELKRTEQYLRESRAQLENLLGSAMDAIITVDEEQHIVLFNAAAEKMFRCSRNEVIGQPVDRFIPGRFRVAHSDHIPAFSQTNVTSRSMGSLGAISGIRANGEEFQIEASISQTEVRGRKLFTVILRDITGRKRAEERFRLAVESAPNAMVMANEEGKIILINSQTERLFGYEREELIGKSVELLVPHRFRGEHPQFREDFSNHPKVRAMGAGRDLHGLRKDGTEVPIEIGLNPIQTETGNLVLSSIVDITERKRSEEERERLLAREQTARRDAENANRLKDEFLATVSHELRTPLTSMLGYAKLLRAGMLDTADSTRALEAIERNTKTQAQIIDDILEVSRIITGKLRLNLRQINPATAIEAAIDAVRPAVEAKGISLSCDLQPSTPTVMADFDRLQQIAWNLLSNAVKFTPERGSIEVRLEQRNHRLYFEVKDSGAGIAPEFLPYVFDRFSQADSSVTRSFGGLGLGLAIVRHLIELHGGTVAVMSAGEGLGATFVVTLPFAAREEAAIASAGGAARGEASKMSQQNDVYPALDGLKVLVVDDDEDTRRMVTMLFERCGSEVRATSTAREALELFELWHPEVMVCDIGMPEEDGYSLIRRVRLAEANRTEQTPAVALTGYARSEDRARALASGYQMHIAKPIDPFELTTAITRLAKRNQQS